MMGWKQKKGMVLEWRLSQLFKHKFPFGFLTPSPIIPHIPFFLWRCVLLLMEHQVSSSKRPRHESLSSAQWPERLHVGWVHQPLSPEEECLGARSASATGGGGAGGPCLLIVLVCLCSATSRLRLCIASSTGSGCARTYT